MRFRKLRIAWSAFCALAAVLLIVLWLRSYSRYDQFIYTLYTEEPTSQEEHWAWNVYANSWKGHVELGLELNNLINPLECDLPGFMSDYEPPFPSHRLWACRWQWVDYLEGFVCVPHWFVSALAASLAIALWLHWRFKLSTMLIATTLVAVALGLIAYVTRQ